MSLPTALHCSVKGIYRVPSKPQNCGPFVSEVYVRGWKFRALKDQANPQREKSTGFNSVIGEKEGWLLSGFFSLVDFMNFNVLHPAVGELSLNVRKAYATADQVTWDELR